MPYFLSQNILKLNSTEIITGEEARHILLSHRVKIGEKIKLQGLNGKRFLTEVLKITKKDLQVKVLKELDPPAELSVNISLFLSVLSEKGLDFVFQKATELGAKEIYLFNSQNTAVKLTKEIFEKKQSRWNKILSESAKQSERAVYPVLKFLPSLTEVSDVLKKNDRVFLADQSGSATDELAAKFKSIGLIVGPEGGFSEQEIGLLKEELNVKIIKLSPFVLRAETAAISGLSLIVSNFI
jgi:16S rRNA (uracil1498-N3)-methyltransferase